MGQNKGIAQRIFNKKNFATITIDLSLRNLTTATQMKDYVKNQSTESLSIGSSSALELLEFHEDHIVLGSAVQFGALGHQVVLDVKVFSAQTREKELLHFSSKLKVTYFEKKIQDPDPIYIAHLHPEEGDLANWNRLFELYAEKQELVNEYLSKVKGTE